MFDRKQRILLELTLKKSYTTADFQKGWKLYIDAFVAAKKDFLLNRGIESSTLEIFNSKKAHKKSDYIQYTLIVFESKEIFVAFLNSLPKNIKTLFDELICRDRISAAEIRDQFDIIIYDKIEEKIVSKYNNHTYSNTHYSTKDEFKIFNNSKSTYSDKSLYLSFDSFILACLLKIYPLPKEAYLNGTTEIEQTDYIYEAEQNILVEIPLLLTYKDQGFIKSSKKGKVTASTLGKMNKKLNLKEFYPEHSNKSIRLLRSQLLASMLIFYSANNKKQPNNIVKEMFRHNYVFDYNPLIGILFYLKGTDKIHLSYSENKSKTFLDLLRKLPSNFWISIEQVEGYFKYNRIDHTPINRERASHRIYYQDWEYVKPPLFDTIIRKPFIKGILFLFSAFGLLDIAYNDITLDDPNKSVYDGLKYIRLNKLGAFVIGKIDTYKLAETIRNPTLLLSSDSLTITIDSNDRHSPIILAPFMVKVSKNRFKTDFDIFLKNILSKEDVINKIKLFKKSVRKEFPPNWIAFFKELDKKTDPLSRVTDTIVFQIPTDDKELQQRIAQDEKLRSLCTKAESFQILVAKKNLEKFKARLRVFGYFI